MPGCPKCGSSMKQRTATRGSRKGQGFWGCSRFPRCKGAINIENKTVQQTNIESQPIMPEEPKEFVPLTDKQKNELGRLRDRLLNLSSRNRSIKLNKLYKSWSFDIARLNQFNIEQPNKIIEGCLQGEQSIPLLPKQTEKSQGEWQRCFDDLSAISKQIDEIYREKGLYDLYIGYPFISGQILETGTVIQAPIFLLPVRLQKIIPQKGQSNWFISIDKEEPIIFNKTLFFALSKMGQYNFNSNIFEENAPIELYGETSFIDWTYNLLNQYGIICSKSDIASDQVIDPLQEFSMKDLPDNIKRGGLTIHQCAVLGHFPQSSSSIQKDYDKLMELGQNELSSLLCFLGEENNQATTTDDSDSINPNTSTGQAVAIEDDKTIDARPEKENFFILSSDSSQDRIIMEVADANTEKLVIWGPPGTGKSQTIVNIISNCLKQNKTVLLVSQKRAALDVVFKRMSDPKHDIGSFAALVHDSYHDRKGLYTRLNSTLENQESQGIEPIDPSEEIERTTRCLQDVAKALNDNSFGIPLGKLYRALGSKENVHAFESLPRWLHANYDDIKRYAIVLNELQQYFVRIGDHEILKNRKSFSKLSNDLQSEFSEMLSKYFKDANVIIAYQITRFQKGQIDLNVLKNYVSGNQDGDNFILTLQKVRSKNNLLDCFTFSFWKNKSKLASMTKDNRQISEGFIKAYYNCLSKIQTARNSKEFFKKLHACIFSSEALESAIKIAEGSFHQFKSFDLLKEQHAGELKQEIDILIGLENENNHNWGTIFEHSILRKWLSILEDKHPILALVRAHKIDGVREKYAHLLNEKSLYAAKILTKSIYDGLRDPKAQKLSQSIKADVSRQRNVKSIRKLNETYISNKIFRNLVPVWLSSPEAVSDVFPLVKGLFDVVIFDEASQCAVENGLPAIYRGKQVVIAGDEKQLPPSHLFELSIDAPEDEDSFASNEPSLLALAKKTPQFKYKMLEWHYRAKYEELINFSNYAFYDGKIKISPNVAPISKDRASAIVWHDVRGYWEERSNPVEAKKVLERLKFLLDDSYTNGKLKSLGIVTFNINQKQLIESLIENEEKGNSEFRELIARNKEEPLDRQLFVKNIENVQGDERDIIIFSVGYAPPAPGERVFQGFGSLSVQGGENRLNVAISRAISSVEIICSIDPEIDLSATSKNLGPIILKDYLCYAKAIANGNLSRANEILRGYSSHTKVRDNSSNLPESPLENEVYEALVALGYRVDCQVGQSGFRIDMAIINPADPTKYALGIECDGAMYHSGISARERDVFRQRFLESRGWKIHRIWSTNWWHSKETELEKIKRIIHYHQPLNLTSVA